jgi:hypothetical protein
MTYEEKLEAMAEAMWQAENVTLQTALSQSYLHSTKSDYIHLNCEG